MEYERRNAVCDKCLMNLDCCLVVFMLNNGCRVIIGIWPLFSGEFQGFIISYGTTEWLDWFSVQSYDMVSLVGNPES